jgi:vacuolar-type H+-ATPase subunit I/STV1
MFAALDLIPDTWQTGPLNEIIMIGAVLAALAVIGRVLVLPVWRWFRRISHGIETAVNRLSDVPVHEDRIDSIEAQIKAIHNALEPTNGDRRSISDRLDTVKYQTAQNTNKIDDLNKMVEELRKEKA